MLVETMVSDQELAKGVETLLRQSDPNSFTSLNGVIQQLEANLGLNLSHKACFIRDHINFLLRAHPSQPQTQPQREHFALLNHHNHPQFPTSSYPQQFSSHFNLNFQHRHPADAQAFPPAPAAQSRQLHSQPRPQPANTDSFSQNAPTVTPTMPIPKESTPVGGKRRGGPGGLNKVCGVSPELQVIVGKPALPRTEIVKQLWAYIRKNNLQDPSNKRKIICDDALRVVFETDCTDMFKMNKLLAKHITALEPTKESQAKRVKTDVEPSTESTEAIPSSVVISEVLAKFLGTGEREMLQSEAVQRVWEYIKANQLEDPTNSMVIMCDEKLRDLLGCESISAAGISEMLARHHLFKR